MQSVLREKAMCFSVRMVKLANYLSDNKQKILANQIVRSGTSIGANLAESFYAASRPDFINKLQISIKEANETKYWLELLFKTECIDEKLYESLQTDLVEIIKLLTSSIRTLKK